MQPGYKRLTMACYATSLSMSVAANVPPLLFLSFRDLYNISYSLLGLLVVIYFITQLCVDLIFSFFSHKFNISLAVKITPLLSAIGLSLYAVWPWIFKGSEYIGLVIGTTIFSASSGFSEVLLSPVIATIPSDDPDRQMSKLHSVYAWGVVFVILVTVVYFLFFNSAHWQLLVLALAIVPLTAFSLFCGIKIPKMQTPGKITGVLKLLKNKSLWLCVFAIFLGGAAECTMAQWCSGYLEMSLGIPKLWGDLLGVMFFAIMLGTGRTLYARYGRNITKILLVSIIGATIGYFIASIINIPFVAILSCGLTGLCVSMLWPGSLIVAADRFPSGGVFIYAIMAAGGDFGASVGPQAVGTITDLSIQSPLISQLATTLSIRPEQLGMKIGMLIGTLFPLFGILVFCRIHKNRNTKRLEEA